MNVISNTVRKNSIDKNEIKVKLLNLLDYDEKSPTFLSWNTERKYVKTNIVGKVYKPNKYYNIKYMYHTFMNHRLIYEIFYGEIPVGFYVDHIDGDTFNNSIQNLRMCSASENGMNSKISKNNMSGVKGLRWCKRDELWYARVRLNKKYYTFSSKSKEESLMWLREKREQLHKEFARHD